jgi:hypothetical protein
VAAEWVDRDYQRYEWLLARPAYDRGETIDAWTDPEAVLQHSGCDKQAQVSGSPRIVT